MKERQELTILPRLNSLNHDPGFSLGHEDILTCGEQNQTTHVNRQNYNLLWKKKFAAG